MCTCLPSFLLLHLTTHTRGRGAFAEGSAWMEIPSRMNGHHHRQSSSNGFHPTEKTSLVHQAQNAYRLNDVEASR